MVNIRFMADPTLPERARVLLAEARVGSLSTHSARFAGFPFGSVMPYAADANGRPIFFISSMAMHTHNLRTNPRASLLIVQPGALEDPLGAPRLTLLGEAAAVGKSEVSELYLERHPEAKAWQDYSDFAYYRMEIAAAYFVGGFGVMGWIAPDEYQVVLK